jgi:N-acetyl-anhydromuramyl-L-alanine amidase AmpD
VGSEYPAGAWYGSARWFTRGRAGYAPRFVVIHYTAGSETRTAAEDGAAYDRRRVDKVSTHYFVDRDSVVQEVLHADQAYAAFTWGNRFGLQIELCGTAQTRDQWFDEASAPTLRNAARLTAWLCQRYGLQPRRLTPGEMIQTRDRWPDGPRGIVGHVDVTRAYGQGDHTDPGVGFPWFDFLRMVNEEMSTPAPAARQGGKRMWVLQLNQPNGKGGTDSSWWKSDTLHCDQLMTWPRVLSHCKLYGQATPYDWQFSDLDEFVAHVGVDVTPDPAGVNIHADDDKVVR